MLQISHGVSCSDCIQYITSDPLACVEHLSGIFFYDLCFTYANKGQPVPFVGKNVRRLLRTLSPLEDLRLMPQKQVSRSLSLSCQNKCTFKSDKVNVKDNL